MASTYTQAGQKRQKVRELRANENADYFQGIDKVEYNNMAANTDSTTYRVYNSSERIHGKSMEEWLKCSVSLTDFRSTGADQAGRATYQRPWDDQTATLDCYKRTVQACVDLCVKLGVKYFTAFDSDLLPPCESWEESRSSWDEMVTFLQELGGRSHVRPLWVAPDLHSHPRYASGAITSNDASTFMHAATQIKKCLEISQRLNCECFLIWPHREGYDAIFKTDVAREIKLFAKLLKITADYKEKLSFRCQMMIMPFYNCSFCDFDNMYGRKWRELERVNRYMWDVTSCLFLLKNNNLDRFYKVCVPPGHQLYMANAYNMVGGVALTDEFDHCDVRRLALMMKGFLDQNAIPAGGVTLKLTPRRDSVDLRDLIATYIKYIDALAKGLRVACNMVTEQAFAKHMQQRYVTYYSGCGARLLSGDISMEECEEYDKKSTQPQNESGGSSRSEHLDVVLQRYLDSD